jgi:alkyl hydroperoxide reductase subunit AhpC
MSNNRRGHPWPAVQGECATMLTIGDRFPAYALKAVVPGDLKTAFVDLKDTSFPGKWTVYMFWPKDFTFVCPTEIVGFDNVAKEFTDRDAQLIGGSIDTEFVHYAWRQSRDDLKKVSYPWLSDVKRELTSALGILDKNEGVALRATFIVDPQGIIRWVAVNDLSVGRNPQEALRVLDALQTDELCPCNWQQGEQTLKAA